MPLPDPVRVKISSEAAGYVSLTPVVAQDLPLRELLEYAAGATGPDAARVAEILRRGSLVSAASRLRWTPLDAPLEEVAALLASLPHAEPDRPFDPLQCVRILFTGPRTSAGLTREEAARRRLLQRRSFWQALTATLPSPVYVDYLYRERCDRYRAPLGTPERASLAASARLLRHRGLAQQLRAGAFDTVDFLAKRA